MGSGAGRTLGSLDLYIPREGFTSLPLGGDIQNRTEDERLQSSRFTIKLYRHMDQYKGFEPSPTEWKSVMLPLHQYWIRFLSQPCINIIPQFSRKIKFCGTWGWIRTNDESGMNRTFYQLNYSGIRLTSLFFYYS